MSQTEVTSIHPVRPIILVGFVGVAIPGFGRFQPDDSIIFVEEPDVIRKRGVQEMVSGRAVVRAVIPWEFHRPGTADAFYDSHRDLDPAAVIPLSEYGTPFAARLAENYGLPGAGFVPATILRDKALLRPVSRAAGIANPESRRVDCPADVLEFFHATGGPVVLKPADRQASVGTQVIRRAADVEQAWADCLTQDEGVFVPDRPRKPRMLVECFVEGAEYSVEMLVQDGADRFANVTAKDLFPGPRPVERAHIVPADAPTDLAELLVASTRRLLESIGFRTGIVHCEWIVRDGVPFLVECAGRMAGDGIIELIEQAYSMELKRAYVTVMKGERLSRSLPRRPVRSMAVRFLVADPGILAAVSGVDEAGRCPGVLRCEVDVAPGDRVPVLRSSWDRIGEIVVGAESSATARRLADEASALIRFDVSDGESCSSAA